MANERLQVSQSYERLHSIMKASEIPDDNIYSDLQIKLESDPTYLGKYYTENRLGCYSTWRSHEDFFSMRWRHLANVKRL